MYRTTLDEEQVEFIKQKWIDEGDSINKSAVSKEMKGKFPGLSEKTVNGIRKQIYYLIPQLEESAHRGESLNSFIDQEEMVGRNVKHAWVKTELADGTKISSFVKNPQYKKELEDLEKTIIESITKHAPNYKQFKRNKIKDGHLLVIDPADIHLGKLCSSFSSGDTYDTNIAVKRCIEGIEGIIQKSSGFNIDHILFIGGNDVLHIDNPHRTTTAGTPQDTDMMWHDNYMIAQKLYVDILERLMTIADVTFLFCPSNHDYTSGFFLCNSIEAWFRNSKNIKFMCNLQHRKYFTYGKNLIGASHGDGAREKDLGPLMSVEAAKEWAGATHRFWYLHHKHHKMSKDYIGVTVEYLRSQSGTDRRHNDGGRTGVPKAVEGFIHHKENGQVSRMTHVFQ